MSHGKAFRSYKETAENARESSQQIRKAKGFSNYEQFAYKYDFNRSSYSRFESGEDIRFSSLLKVLEALDMSLSEFFSEGFEEMDSQADLK